MEMEKLEREKEKRFRVARIETIRGRREVVERGGFFWLDDGYWSGLRLQPRTDLMTLLLYMVFSC